MTYTWPDTDLMGEPHPADLPGRANLTRAVVLGGEGGTLTLLGPLDGEGEFLMLRPNIVDVDEEGFATYDGAALVPAGLDLIPALDQLNPGWRRMVGVHVSPHYELEVRRELKRAPEAKPYDLWRHPGPPSPLRCRFVWPSCDLWPDGVPRDGFWVEGTIDQVRDTLGRVPHDHQVQLGEAAHEPFVMLISRDGTQRHSLPHIPSSEEDPWPSEVFLPVGPHDLHDLAQLRDIPVPGEAQQHDLQCTSEEPGDAALQNGILNIEHAMQHYEALRQAKPASHPGHTAVADTLERALWAMAQVTWPFQVMLSEADRTPRRTAFRVYLVHGQGMEEEVWHLLGDHRERDAVRLSVVMRNLYYAGNVDALSTGHLAGYLRYALPAVLEINTTGEQAQ